MAVDVIIDVIVITAIAVSGSYLSFFFAAEMVLAVDVTTIVATMVYLVEIAVALSSLFYFFAAAAVTASALVVADASLNIYVQKELVYSSFCFCKRNDLLNPERSLLFFSFFIIALLLNP